MLLMPFSCFAGTIVRVGTSIGDFSVELFDDSAPMTVENFLNCPWDIMITMELISTE